MKKWILIVVVVGMLGYAVFDFWNSNKESADQFETVDEGQEMENENENENESNAGTEELTIGLNVGNQAPDFELETLTGENVKLSDFRGKRVMINFWATWCPPCRAEMPDMEKFYHDKDVVVLAVNLTDTESSIDGIEDFTEEYNLTFPILMDTNLDVATLYGIQPLPTSYLVDSNGIVSNMAFGALNYDLMVQEFEKME